MYRQAVAPRHRLPERATAVALLLLLHAALLLLVSPKFGIHSETPPLNEITLSFSVSKPREAQLPAITPAFIRPRAPMTISPSVIPESSQRPAPVLTAPNITGVGRSLFNCDLANAKNLSREERANCVNFGVAPPTAGTMEAGLPKNSQAKHSELWSAQLAARRAPVRLPCTSVQQQVLGGPGAEKPVTAIMANPLCVLNGLLNGFHSPPK